MITILEMSLRVGIAFCAALFLAFPVAGYASGPEFTEQPGVVANPNPRVPQAAVVAFASDRPVATTLTVSAGDENWELRYDSSRNPADGLAIVGLLPATKHKIAVAICDSAGKVSSAPEDLEFTTPPLPNDRASFPPIKVTVNKGDQLEPGYVLFNPRRRKPGRQNVGFGAGFGMLLIPFP